MLSSSFERTYSFGKSGTFSVDSRWFQNAEERLASREGDSYVRQERRQQHISKLCACLSTPCVIFGTPPATPPPPADRHGEEACGREEGGRPCAGRVCEEAGSHGGRRRSAPGPPAARAVTSPEGIGEETKSVPTCASNTRGWQPTDTVLERVPEFFWEFHVVSGI